MNLVIAATAIFPLIVAGIGILMYALCVNPKLQEAGRILFAVGAFFAVQIISGAIGKVG